MLRCRLWFGEGLPHFDKFFLGDFPSGKSRLQDSLGIEMILGRPLQAMCLGLEDPDCEKHNQEKNQAPQQQGE
jgi:hypothetical protein